MPQTVLKNMLVSLTIVLVALVLSTPANAGIVLSGSVYPSTVPGDGIVTSELRIGVSFQSTGSVTVTDATLTTHRTFLGYTVAAGGTVNLTNSTWTAESAVFVAPESYTVGTVNLNNSIWDVNSNMTIAKGSDSTANITLDGGSLWSVEFNTDLGEKGTATVTINDGTWMPTGAIIGGGEFCGEDGTGTINIMADGILDAQNSITLNPNGTITLDGGLLCLTGKNLFEGTLSATSNGGTIRLDAARVYGQFGRVDLGNGIDLTNCDIEIYFHEGYTPNPAAEFNLFDPCDSVNLATTLGNATSITTPTGWVLDYETGIMTAVPEPSTLLLIATALLSLAIFRPKRR